MYSYDFIKTIIKVYDNRKRLNMTVNMTVNEIGIFYEISKQSIYNWLKGNLKLNKNKRVFVRSIHKDKKYIEYVIKYVKENPQFIIKDLLRNLILLFETGITKQTIYNILKRENITRKIVQVNKYPHTQEKYESEIKKLQKMIKNRKDRIISIDETSIQLNIKCKYGWSLKGDKCIIKSPHRNKNVRYSLLFAISKKRVIKYYLKEGTINGEDYKKFIEEVDKKYKIYKYLMDNARIHHTKIINENVKKKFIYNVPYSPEFNPIEYVNNELKRQIKMKDIKNENELKIFIEMFIKRSQKDGYDRYFEKSYKNLGI